MKKLMCIVFCMLTTSLCLNGMDVRHMYPQDKKPIKPNLKKEPYRLDELGTVMSHFATIFAGLGMMATGYLTQQPFVASAGFAFFIGGSNEWKQYNKYERYNALKKIVKE